MKKKSNAALLDDYEPKKAKNRTKSKDRLDEVN